jgi:hypothetical protein
MPLVAPPAHEDRIARGELVPDEGVGVLVEVVEVPFLEMLDHPVEAHVGRVDYATHRISSVIGSLHDAAT